MYVEKSKKHEKIAILICFLGKLPWYFNYFIHSCKYNPTVDFYVFSDDLTYNKVLPENVKLIYKTIDEINEIASQKLGFSTNIKYPYKLCDFKPTYGILFSDIIKNYDFWGHGDIDVIFGDIRSFITNEILAEHDLICVRHDFLTGYFLLFRNNEKMNSLYTKSKDYKKVLQNESHYCFDETNFEWEAFEAGLPLPEIKSEIESMMHVVRRQENEGYLKAYFDFLVIEGLPGKLKWVKGKLFYRNRYEVLLYHLIHFKNKFKPKRIGTIPEIFNISPNKIYKQKAIN